WSSVPQIREASRVDPSSAAVPRTGRPTAVAGHRSVRATPS
ncbi:MAG: hypothetical protein AVDCRST_MAG70-2023, partial [uncultured Thermomicrobiales bacterium]